MIQINIKFRAWDEEQNTMWVAGNGEAIHLKHFFDEYDDLPIMQYTGLLDKNGVEIYEGDIVTHKGEYLSLKKPAFVIFENGRFVMDCGNGDTNRLYKWSDGWSIEVIGNIYENSDLL